MRYLLWPVRKLLSWIIVFVDYITRPEPIERPEDDQKRVEEEVDDMAVYQFAG